LSYSISPLILIFKVTYCSHFLCPFVTHFNLIMGFLENSPPITYTLYCSDLKFVPQQSETPNTFRRLSDMNSCMTGEKLCQNIVIKEHMHTTTIYLHNQDFCKACGQTLVITPVA
jgi:hypothetical protein